MSQVSQEKKSPSDKNVRQRRVFSFYLKCSSLGGNTIVAFLPVQISLPQHFTENRFNKKLNRLLKNSKNLPRELCLSTSFIMEKSRYR